MSFFMALASNATGATRARTVYGLAGFIEKKPGRRKGSRRDLLQVAARPPRAYTSAHFEAEPK